MIETQEQFETLRANLKAGVYTDRPEVQAGLLKQAQEFKANHPAPQTLVGQTPAQLIISQESPQRSTITSQEQFEKIRGRLKAGEFADRPELQLELLQQAQLFKANRPQTAAQKNPAEFDPFSSEFRRPEIFGGGLIDAAFTGVKNIGGLIASGLAGAASLPFVGADRAANITTGIQEAVIGPPVSEQGKRVSELVAKPFEFLAEGVNKSISGLVGLGALATGQGADAASQQIQSVQQKGVSGFLGDTFSEGIGPFAGALAKAAPSAVLLSPLLRVGGRISPKPISETTGRAGSGAEATITKSQSIPPETTPLTERAINASKPSNVSAEINPIKSGVAPERKAYEQIVNDLKKQKTKTAEEVLPDQNILAAADDLGVDLNPSHYSTNQVFIEVEQALKSKPGSKLGSVETVAIEKLGQRADELIADLGGQTDKALLDFRIRSEIDSTILNLEKQSTAQYKIVNDTIPATVRVKAQATKSYLTDRLNELGGDKSLLTTAEKELLRVSGEGKFPTYAAIDRIRKRVGQGFRREGPYKEDDSGILRQVYKVLSEDQQGVGDSFGVGANYSAARRLVASRKQIEDQSVALLGRNLSGSVIPKITQAATALTKGDVSKFRTLMAALPKSKRAEVAASLLNDLFSQGARQKTSLGQGFVKAFEGLNRNLTAKKLLFEHLPAGAEARFNQLGTVAVGIYRAKAFENTSGTARALIANMDDGGAFAKIYQTSAKAAVAEVVSSAVGLPGAGTAGVIFAQIAKKATPASEAADAFITSPKFAKAIQKAAQGNVAEADTIIRNSSAFKRWATTINKNDAARIGAVGFIAWLLSGDRSGQRNSGLLNVPQQPQFGLLGRSEVQP